MDGGNDRLRGITSIARDMVVSFVGTSGSSPVIEKFSRVGLKTFIFVDPGNVKEATLTRMAFDHAQIGMPKVDALKEVVLRAHAPGEEPDIHTYACKVEDVPIDIFKGVDLIIAGTDDRHAQNYVSKLAKKLDIPFIAIGFHEDISGGHIQWCVPGDGNACYQCGPIGGRLSDDVADEAANMTAAAGCIIDGLQVDLHAARIAISILERGQDTLMGRFYEAIKHKGYAVVSNHPEYEFGNGLMDALLGDLPTAPKDYAHELRQYLPTGHVIWLEAGADPECPVCGKRQ